MPDEIEILLKQFKSIGFPERLEARERLAALDRESTITHLIALLRDQLSEWRDTAAEALLRLDAERGTEAIIPVLAENDASLRWHLCGLLHDFGTRAATEALLRIAKSDPDGDVRHIAVWALGSLGDISVIEHLRGISSTDLGTDREGRTIRQEAIEAIHEIQGRLT